MGRDSLEMKWGSQAHTHTRVRRDGMIWGDIRFLAWENGGAAGGGVNLIGVFKGVSEKDAFSNREKSYTKNIRKFR